VTAYCTTCETKNPRSKPMRRISAPAAVMTELPLHCGLQDIHSNDSTSESKFPPLCWGSLPFLFRIGLSFRLPCGLSCGMTRGGPAVPVMTDDCFPNARWWEPARRTAVGSSWQERVAPGPKDLTTVEPSYFK